MKQRARKKEKAREGERERKGIRTEICRVRVQEKIEGGGRKKTKWKESLKGRTR